MSWQKSICLVWTLCLQENQIFHKPWWDHWTESHWTGLRRCVGWCMFVHNWRNHCLFYLWCSVATFTDTETVVSMIKCSLFFTQGNIAVWSCLIYWNELPSRQRVFFDEGVTVVSDDCPSSSLYRDQTSSAKSSQVKHRKSAPNRPMWSHSAQGLISSHQWTTPANLLIEGKENDI